MARFALLASDPLVAEVGDQTLRAGGSALSAALSGFFFAAGLDASVLFSSLSLLVGGVGSGVFAYDGRLRQPGIGAKRPRGFVAEAEVGAAARAAVPASVAAAAMAVAFHPGTTLLPCARLGVQTAKGEGQLGRAALLEIVASLGATALSDPRVKKSFLAQFGPMEEGSMTPQDMIAPAEVNIPAVETQDGWVLPWNTEGPIGESDEPEVIVVADSRGLFVALSYGAPRNGTTLSPYQVSVPELAVPVMRGVTRTPPGSPLPAFHDLRLERDAEGKLSGVSARQRPGAGALSLLRANDSREVHVVREDTPISDLS